MLVPFAAAVRRDALPDDHDLRLAPVAADLHAHLATFVGMNDERGDEKDVAKLDLTAISAFR
jgi:hypothetical protein